MVKKLKELAGEAGNGMSGPHLADTIRESAQQIWHAGLGAFSKAQEEGGKVYEALVKEGKALESTTRKMAEQKIAGLTANFGRKTEAASARASATWDKLEQVFEDRVARALGRLGVPSAKELETLAKRVEELTASVRALGGSSRGPAVKARSRTARVAKPATKPAVKRGASRKAA